MIVLELVCTQAHLILMRIDENSSVVQRNNVRQLKFELQSTTDMAKYQDEFQIKPFTHKI